MYLTFTVRDPDMDGCLQSHVVGEPLLSLGTGAKAFDHRDATLATKWAPLLIRALWHIDEAGSTTATHNLMPARNERERRRITQADHTVGADGIRGGRGCERGHIGMITLFVDSEKSIELGTARIHLQTLGVLVEVLGAVADTILDADRERGALATQVGHPSRPSQS